MADDIQIQPAGQGNQQNPPTGQTTGQGPVVQQPTTQNPPQQTAPVPPVPPSTPAPPAPPAPAAPAPPAPPSSGAALLQDAQNASGSGKKPERYLIPKVVKEKYPDLVELIKQTESMDDEEREYWFQVLPIMTDEQVQKFKGILETEKRQLAELDKEYEQELKQLNEKHMLEWKEFETKEKRQTIRKAEAKSEQQEAKVEEELLAKLSDI